MYPIVAVLLVLSLGTRIGEEIGSSICAVIGPPGVLGFDFLAAPLAISSINGRVNVPDFKGEAQVR